MALRYHKYHARLTVVDGISFDSALEARRYAELRLLEKARKLDLIAVHPVFQIYLRGVPICKVELDFQYIKNNDNQIGSIVYEDCKGYDTPVSRLKRKLFEAQYKAKVVLIRSVR